MTLLPNFHRKYVLALLTRPNSTSSAMTYWSAILATVESRLLTSLAANSSVNSEITEACLSRLMAFGP